MAQKEEHAFLVGKVNDCIRGIKLPSNRQALSFLFFNTRVKKLSVRESSNLVIRQCVQFWNIAGIPTRKNQHSINKLCKLHSEWRDLQKTNTKSSVSVNCRMHKFKKDLDNLFDIAHVDAFDLIKHDYIRLP